MTAAAVTTTAKRKRTKKRVRECLIFDLRLPKLLDFLTCSPLETETRSKTSIKSKSKKESAKNSEVGQPKAPAIIKSTSKKESAKVCGPAPPHFISVSSRTATKMSESIDSTETNAAAVVLQQVETLSKFKMQGTKEYPYIITVNLDKPEQNWGFEVSRVPGIEHRDFVRDAFHIRKVSFPSQEHVWEACIPREQCPQLAERSVLIRGPSQAYWHQDAERYHQLTFCDKTKTVHETLQTNINGTPERVHSHWLLVFPEGHVLENHVFSDDATHVKTCNQDLIADFTVDEGDADAQETVDLFGLDIYWRIALQGGERIRSPDARARRRYAHRRSRSRGRTDIAN